MESLVRVQDLTFSYKETHVKPLDGVSFAIEKGSIFGLVGKNGAGKTTLLQVLLGTLHPDAGFIEIAGVKGESILRHKIGFVPERPYYHQNFRLKEYLSALNQIAANHLKAVEIDQLIDFVHLSDFTGEHLRNFSKGMLQRVGVAQALLSKPEILILDEPMSGLDVVGQNMMREIILEINGRGTTVIISSHNLYEIERLSDAIGVLHLGKLKLIQKELLQKRQQFELTLEKTSTAGELVHFLAQEKGVRENDGVLTFPAADQELYFRILTYLTEKRIRISKLETAGMTLEQYILDYLREGGEGDE